MALFLGLDSSTQSLTGIVLEIERQGSGYSREIVSQVTLKFDVDLPEYGTRKGVLPDEDPCVVHSSPLLWADALDRLLARLREKGVDVGAIRAIAGSGQQHGSVYLNATASATLAALDPGEPLAAQIRGIFSRDTSPIWMDSSTSEECSEITGSLGGAQAVAELTGSSAFERFTGPQIRKFYKHQRAAYDATDRIHLVSSFMATLLLGDHAPVDPGDGAGTNLMSIRDLRWAPEALQATADGLEAKLPPVRPSSTIVGRVSDYFVRRHGLAPDAQVVAWSGDNPCSLIGVGLVKTGRFAVSLGTSDTLFGFMPELRVDPAGEGHVFGSPTGHYMSLICFKNGSLARERVRDRYEMDWPTFNEALRSTPPGNGGAVLLPWFDPEITPNVLESEPRLYGLDWDEPARLVRGVVEGQMASMAIHSRWMDVRAESIYATGGASANRELLQVMADVFGAEVIPSSVGQSAALGAALRAWHAERLAAGEEIGWEEIVDRIADPDRSRAVKPCDRQVVTRYRQFQEVYRACENHALERGPDPTRIRQDFARQD